MKVYILEHIENNSNILLLCIQKGCHRLNRYFSGLFIGKMKFSSGNTAKGNALAVVLHGQFQTGVIAGGEGFTILLSDSATDNRPHGMEDIFARQIESRRDLCLPHRLLMALFAHHVITQESQLDTTPGMHDVIDTGVERSETAQQCTICGIYDCIDL